MQPEPETGLRSVDVKQLPEHRPSLSGAAGAICNSPAFARPESTGLASGSPSRSGEARFVGWEVPLTDRAPGLVRRRASALLAGWGRADVAGDAATVLTELVTNACQAGASRVVVLVEPDAGPGLIEVCVWDDAPGEPRVREVDWCAERGRGLLLVDSLAVAWGHHPLPLRSERPGAFQEPGKVVWARLAGSGGGA